MSDDNRRGTKRDTSDEATDQLKKSLTKKMKEAVAPWEELQTVWQGWKWFIDSLRKMEGDYWHHDGCRIESHDAVVLSAFMKYHRFSPHSIGNVPRQCIYDLVDRWNCSHLSNNQLSIGSVATVLSALDDWISEESVSFHLDSIVDCLTDLKKETKVTNKRIDELKAGIGNLSTAISIDLSNHARALTQ